MLRFLKRPAIKVLLFVIGVSVFALTVFDKAKQLAEAPKTEKGCPAPQIDQNHIEIVSSSLASTLTWFQRGGTINDASCLSETKVHGIVKIKNEDDIADALEYARRHDLSVSVAGVRHSMGGHAFAQNGLVLDMLELNDVEVHEEKMTMTVQSGATWHDIQNVLHPQYAVSAMQSTDIFSVGGSISVNAHGMDHRIGAIENTIKWIRVMLPDGTIKKVSREENTDLYDLVVGGYGLFGIILDVELAIVPNDVYESERVVMPFDEFPSYFANEIAENEDIGLMYTHLSTAPSSLLDEAIVYLYRKIDTRVAPENIPPLKEVSSVKMRRFMMNFSKLGALPQQLRWWAEKYIEPRLEFCSITRTQAISSGEACMVARNEPMHDSVPYLYNNLKRETDILHEYFIPRENIVPFIQEMRALVRKHEINLLNTSIRVVNQERGMLTYAPEKAFSVVLFINQEMTPEGDAKMERDTKALIDLAHEYNGRFFLPYKLHYTKKQLHASYPNINTFLAKKTEIDPEERLTSTFYRYLKD